MKFRAKALGSGDEGLAFKVPHRNDGDLNGKENGE